MSSIGGISQSMAGMMAASQQMQVSMVKMANASEGGDIAALLADMVTSQVSFEANAQVMKSQADGIGQLLDVMA